MHISEFDYDLPKELIAQVPAEKRDGSRLMVLNRADKSITHKNFFDITEFFNENDVIVMNDTRVIPARLIGMKSTGAKIEAFLLCRKSEKIWECLIKPSKRVKAGTEIGFSESLNANIVERTENDKWLIEFQYGGDFYEILNKTGNIPLPPYIARNMNDEDIKKLDYQRYQTVYAAHPGSVAAPTAGLHFTQELLKKLDDKGVKRCAVTLNVGMGTFKPVRAENILDHQMDSEKYEISETTSNIINEAKANGKKIVAVGTTTVRTLESCHQKYGKILPVQDESRMFIYPGYKFNVIDKLITNFHLPKSTLLMLISALASKEYIFRAYDEAIINKYRFYSYGDCMFIQ